MKALGVALMSALVLVGTIASAYEVRVGMVCAGKPVHVTTKTQIKDFAKVLKADEKIDCPPLTRQAIEDLYEIVSSEFSTCSLEHVNLIKNFFEKFTHSNIKMKLGLESKIPKSLLNFAIAYGVKTDIICKVNMIEQLPKAINDLLKPEDFSYLDKYTSSNSMLGKVLNNQNDFDNIMLPVLIRDNLAFTGRAELEKIHVQFNGATNVSTAQQICAARFHSIYEQLILPTIFLSNLGLSYQGTQFEWMARARRMEDQLHQWYRIVFLCEAVKMVVPHEGSNLLRLGLLKSNQAASKEIAFDNSIHLKTIKYEADISKQQKLDEIILDSGDENLMKFIDSFKKHRRYINLARAKIFKRIAKFFVKKVTSTGFNVFKSFIKKITSKKNSDDTEITMAVIRTLDDQARQLEKTETGAVRRKRDTNGDDVVNAAWVLILVCVLLSFTVSLSITHG